MGQLQRPPAPQALALPPHINTQSHIHTRRPHSHMPHSHILVTHPPLSLALYSLLSLSCLSLSLSRSSPPPPLALPSVLSTRVPSRISTRIGACPACPCRRPTAGRLRASCVRACVLRCVCVRAAPDTHVCACVCPAGPCRRSTAGCSPAAPSAVRPPRSLLSLSHSCIRGATRTHTRTHARARERE